MLRRRARGVGEADHIRQRYGRLVMPVTAIEDPAHGSMVNVDSIDALARLAEHYQRFILYHQGDGAHTYLLQEGGTRYRYRPDPQPHRPSPPPAVGLRPVCGSR